MKMKMGKLAQIEFRAAIDRYEIEVGFDRSRDFFKELKEGLKRIRQYPEAWGYYNEAYDVRKYGLRKPYPYAFLYLYDDDLIFITALMHLERHPEYWIDRMDDVPPEMRR